MKALIASSLVLMLAAPPPPPPPPPPVVAIPFPFVTEDAGVVRVECRHLQGRSFGSAVHLGNGRYITAAHVLEDAICSIGPSPIKTTHYDRESDFATFEAPPIAQSIRVSCRGFRVGQFYLARGYAGGGAVNAHLPWIVSPFPKDGLDIALGTTIPGMSGGPVLDERGRVVGVVLRHTPSAAIPLKSTPICNRS